MYKNKENYHKYYLNDNSVLDNNFIRKDIDGLIQWFKKYKIKSNDVILCKSSSIYGVFCIINAVMSYGGIPFFFPFNYKSNITNDLEDKYIKLLNIKLLVDINHENKINVNITDTFPASDLVLPDRSVIFLTSATTGEPKMILKTIQQLFNESRRYVEYLNITEDDVLLPSIRIDNSFGIGSCIFPALITNAAISDPNIILPKNIIKSSIRNKATILFGSVFMHQKLIEISKKYKLYDKMRFSISTGSVMQEKLQNDYKNCFNIDLLHQYGSSETGSLSVSEPGDEAAVVGRALNGVKFEIIEDEEKRPVIYISSPDTIGAYINENEIIQLPGYKYQTNDIGKLRKDGKLEVLGRKDDVVSLDGLKVSLNYIRNNLLEYPGIIDLKLFVKNLNGTKEIHCEYIGDKILNKDNIIEFCYQKLPRYQVPRVFSQVEKLGNTSIKLGSWKNSFTLDN